MTAKELRERRAKLIADARKLHQEHEAEWTNDRQQQFDKMLNEASDLLSRAKSLEKLEGYEENLNDPANPKQPSQAAPNIEKPAKPGENPAPGSRVMVRSNGRDEFGHPRYMEIPATRRGSTGYQKTFTQYLLGDMTPADRRANLQSDVDEKGGYLVVPEQFAAGLLKAVDDLVFIRRNGTVITVREATSLGIRCRTARMSTFGYGAELQVQANDTALKFGKKILTPHHLTGSVRISRDNLRRNVLGADTIVTDEMARDASEVQEQKFLTGSGAAEPLGVFTVSSDGITTARDVLTGSSTAITADGLYDAKFALKSQYRLPSGERSGARWLFHRDAIKQIAKLKETTNQYLWQPGLREGNPDILLGMPVDESEKVPNTFTTQLYVGILAQWRFYYIADSLDMEVQTLQELYAETNEIGYIGRLKNDGMPVLEEAFVRLITN